MSYPDRILARVRTQRPWVQRIVITSLAATTAWLLGGMVNSSDALVAAIVVVITLRTSLQASLGEGFGQLLGTAVGVGVAFVSIHTVGTGAVAIGLTMAISLLIAHVLRLDDGGGMNIAITALIVLGPGMPEATALDRTWATIIGVAVALVFSYWAHPSTPVGRTQKTLASVAAETADLLSVMAQGVSSGYSQTEAGQWLEKSRAISDRTQLARSQAEEAIRYARWSPIAPRDEADAIYTRFVAVEHMTVQVRTVARSLYDAVTQGIELSDMVGQVIGDMLKSASRATQTKATAVESDPHARPTAKSMSNLRDDSYEALTAVKGVDDTGELILGASLVSSIERLTDSLDMNTPAISEVPTPAGSTTTAEKVGEALGTLGNRLRPHRPDDSGADETSR